MKMLIILTCCFANVMYIINQTRGDDYGDYMQIDEDGVYNNRVVKKYLCLEVLNSIIYSYKLSLGDFDIMGFRGDNQYFVWFLFIVATFLLQITFLNMLIAIMGNTFDQVMDTKQQSAMRERISILSDFRLVVRALKLDYTPRTYSRVDADGHV